MKKRKCKTQAEEALEEVLREIEMTWGRPTRKRSKARTNLNSAEPSSLMAKSVPDGKVTTNLPEV